MIFGKRAPDGTRLPDGCWKTTNGSHGLTGKDVVFDMGKKASQPLDLGSCEELEDYLHCNHAAYMRYGHKFYYITDVGENYWRAQDTSLRNHKNHFIDCSEIVPTLGEFMSLRFLNGQTIRDVFDHATFYASVFGEKDA